MKSIQFINSKNSFYSYYITCKEKTSYPRCKYPRETVVSKLRTFSVNYINYDEEIVKCIIYPKELYFTQVLPDDIIENEIIEIGNYIPDWTRIEVVRNHDIKLLK